MWINTCLPKSCSVLRQHSAARRPHPQMTSDPEAGRDEGCPREEKGQWEPPAHRTGSGPWPCLPGLLAALLPSPGGGLHPRDTWSSAPLALPSSPCFLPPGPASHCHRRWEAFQGQRGILSHPLGQASVVQGVAGSFRGAGWLSQALDSQPLERTFLGWCPLGIGVQARVFPPKVEGCPESGLTRLS